MIVRHKDSEVLEVTIQDTVYLGKTNALGNFQQYLQTKMLELEKAISSSLFVMPDHSEFLNKKEGIIFEGNQKKPELKV